MISFELGKSLQQHFIASLPALQFLFVHCPEKSWHYGDRVRTDNRVISAHFGYTTKPFRFWGLKYFGVGAES